MAQLVDDRQTTADGVEVTKPRTHEHDVRTPRAPSLNPHLFRVGIPVGGGAQAWVRALRDRDAVRPVAAVPNLHVGVRVAVEVCDRRVDLPLTRNARSNPDVDRRPTGLAVLCSGDGEAVDHAGHRVTDHHRLQLGVEARQHRTGSCRVRLGPGRR